jgi:hypothetical protein
MLSENEFVSWLSLLSLQERARALTRMCASLTVSARTLFFPKVIPGNEATIIRYFQGLNELHHTLTNQIMAYLIGEELYSLEGLNDMLLDVGTTFGVKVPLATAVEWARTRTD